MNANDAMFWLGRVQFMKSSYEKAAMTFTSLIHNILAMHVVRRQRSGLLNQSHILRRPMKLFRFLSIAKPD